MHLETIDFVVLAIYAVMLLGIALWVSREEEGHQKNTSDYFLAGRQLPWWAIGASLIAANISAEQIIGMSGSAYAMGFAIASYEWMAAITLILVGKYLLPVFLEQRIYTMPQFLEKRYDQRVKILLAIFWIGVYVFVNLTSVLWLGSLALYSVAGMEIEYALILLTVFAVGYSIYGGLKAVALTDIIQVVLLVLGGLLIAYFSLQAVSNNSGAYEGFKILLKVAPEKFDMILDKNNPHYMSLPGISVLVGGLWVMNLSYWGFNQYIIQRALAAKNVREAQKGIAFAAFLKMLMPVIVVLPGITAVILAPNLDAPDMAYPEVMKLLPAGLTGLVFAALIAAIVSSLASMMNSIATIFTMDVYRSFSTASRSESSLVNIGRITSLSAIVTAAIIARPLLGQFDQAFQYIQEFTGFFTPGIVTIFLLAIFWRGANANGALGAALASVILSVLLKSAFPGLPFMDRIAIVFLCCVAVMVLISMLSRDENKPSQPDYSSVDTHTATSFNFAALLICIMLIAIYGSWW